MLISPEEINSRMIEYTDIVDYELLKKAYVFALNKHGTQLRESGDPYFSHPLEVAEILLNLKMDQETIIAGMLHDTLEDTNTAVDELKEQFGKKITGMVKGVTKLSKFEGMSVVEKQVEDFRKLLISAASDIRVLIIKLADRLHNMRTLKYKKKKSRRQFIAKETLEIYAPLAERLGLIEIKDELQNMAFLELYPDIYNSIKTRLKKLYDSSEELIATISEKLEKLAKTVDENCTVTGRIKTPYSIWKKLNQQGMTFEQLSDIMAFRIIVDTIPHCYQVLGLIHKNYSVIPGKFRDYISTPKDNGYQSLHTSIIEPLGKRIEIQIRTKEMHLVAEYGVAAHWNYKLGERADKSRAKRDILWINNLVSILKNSSGIDALSQGINTEVYSKMVFCLTPTGEVVSLPEGSSVLDFAYYIHSDVGNHAVGAKVNGNPAPLDTLIKNGDQIEITTDNHSFPKSSWENFVITTKAKVALNKELNSLSREQVELMGKSNLEDFFKSRGIGVSTSDLGLLAKSFNFASIDKLFCSIGRLEITMQQVLAKYNELKKTNITFSKDENDAGRNSKRLLPVIGLPKGLHWLPVSCCTPVAGDRIYGILLRGKGVEIHIEECLSIAHFRYHNNGSIIPLHWRAEAFDSDAKYNAKLSILLKQASGNLAHISDIVERRKSSILSLSIGEKFENLARIQIEVAVHDAVELSLIIADLRSFEAIRKVSRNLSAL